MADQGQTPAGNEPSSGLPEDGVTSADFTVRQALAELSFLRPDSPAAPRVAMPEEVWTSLALTLQAEQARRSHGWRRRPRLLTAVVAAAAVVIAGGVVVQSRQSSEPALVAADVPAPQAVAASAALPALDPAGPAVPPREPAGSQLAPDSPAVKGNLAPSTLGDAQLPTSTPPTTEFGNQGGVAPVRRVLASGTNYRAETLGDQVEALLAQLGITSKRDLEALPQQSEPLVTGKTGFTASEEALTSCLVTLRGPITAVAQQAYLVDRARFAGEDVGLVLLPADDASTPLMFPEPSATVGTNAGLIDIWIVTPACGPLNATPVHHLLHELSFP